MQGLDADVGLDALQADIFTNCLTMAFLGVVRIWTEVSSSRSSSVAMIGKAGDQLRDHAGRIKSWGVTCGGRLVFMVLPGTDVGVRSQARVADVGIPITWSAPQRRRRR